MDTNTERPGRRRTLVFGPAYLDRVLRVDRPLTNPRLGRSLDQSVDGTWRFGDGLTLVDPVGGTLAIDLPADWPGPSGVVELGRALIESPGAWRRHVAARGWHDDLGGMGAGFAAALGGELVGALGPEDDAIGRAVAERLGRAGIRHRVVRVEGRPSDWTLLITSAEFGDKLAIGFRGCHAAVPTLAPWAAEPCDLRVVASLPNRLAESVLRAPGAAVRFFAPSSRNVLDRERPLGRFADAVDLLSCNRREWEALADRESVAGAVPLVAVTDGPRGSRVRFRKAGGRAGIVEVPAFPRERPPRDTNRAGEAYAATLVATLLDAGWVPGPVDEGLIRAAAWRASAAAALVLDEAGFGFPGPVAIDDALRAGRVVAGGWQMPDD